MVSKQQKRKIKNICKRIFLLKNAASMVSEVGGATGISQLRGLYQQTEEKRRISQWGTHPEKQW